MTASDENAGTAVSLHLLTQNAVSPEAHGLDLDGEKSRLFMEQLEFAANRVIADNEALLILASPPQPSSHPATMAIVWRAE